MIKEIVRKLPNFIKRPTKRVYNSIPDNLKYGKVFNDTYSFLQESQYWSKEKLEEYQMNEITKLLNHSYKNVPYYRKVFDERGLKPRDIQNFNDLKQLPYLTKEIIQNNLEDLVARNYDKRNLTYVTTGGSTGIPMGFYADKRVVRPREWAFMTTQWSRVGYDINKKNKCVILRGNIPEKGLYEYDGKDLILSSYQLTDNNMKMYINMIKKFEPDFIQAYPSSISILSDFILQNDIKLNLYNLKAILCGSENLYDFQRIKIKDAFNVRVYSWYGHTEVSCLAGECEKSSSYHIFPEYGYTELINENDNDVTGEDEVGEIVATGFNNYAVPFIRYKTMDLAVNTNKVCSCGRNYKLIKRIEGRKQDYFINRYGNKITFTCSDDALWRVNDKIFAYQYIQNEPGKVILTIEPKKELDAKDYKCIRQDFLKFYPDFEIEIKLVEHIERTKRGKYKFLIQKLKI